MVKHQLLGILAESPIHVGSGQVNGPIDLPVAREVTTRYPYIPGSGLKGSLRDKIEHATSKSVANTFFGSENSAAGISVADARLLLLPIRSLSGPFRWVTCPYILERLTRDLQMMSSAITLPEVNVTTEQAWITTSEDEVYLEEYAFEAVQETEKLTPWIELITQLVAHESVKSRLGQYLTIVSDEDFATLTETGLYFYARNSLEKTSKISKGLWYEEALPPDCLLYTLLFARNPQQEGHMEQLIGKLAENPYIQVGGNETIGQGWTILSVYQGGRI
jgi:CRISPR-associated protein Cmr4